LYDAVFEVTENHFKKISGRKAIILLTDGKDHGSQVSSQQLLETAAESDAMIYSVFYTTKEPNFNRRLDPFPGNRRIEPFPPINRGGRRRFPLLQFPQTPQRMCRRGVFIAAKSRT
jgi:hypothetical protein